MLAVLAWRYNTGARELWQAAVHGPTTPEQVSQALWNTIEPGIAILCRFLLVPYALSVGLLPCLGLPLPLTLLLGRIAGPLNAALIAVAACSGAAARWLRDEHDRVRDSIYRVGEQLVNRDLPVRRL